MRKHVNLVDLVKSFPTKLLLQILASIQKRTSPVKFARLAEKSEKGSISNLSTKQPIAPSGAFEKCLVNLRENNEGSRAEVCDRFFRSCDGDRFSPPDRKSQNDSSGNLSSILSPPAASLLPEPMSFPLFWCTDQLAWPSCEWFENSTNI